MKPITIAATVRGLLDPALPDGAAYVVTDGGTIWRWLPLTAFPRQPKVGDRVALRVSVEEP